MRHLLVDPDLGVWDPDRPHPDLLWAVDVLEGAVPDVGALVDGDAQCLGGMREDLRWLHPTAPRSE